MMKAFYDALRESIITQALLTLMIVGSWLYMTVNGLQPPELLSSAMVLVLGFYFGSKVGFNQGQKSMSPYIPKRFGDDKTKSPKPHKLKTNVLGKER